MVILVAVCVTYRGVRMLLPGRDDDVLGNLFVDRPDVVVALAVVKNSDDRRMRAAEHAEDASFGTSVGANRSHRDQYTITMHRGCESRRRNEDIAHKVCRGRFAFLSIIACTLGNHESVTIAMHSQAADECIASGEGLRQRVLFAVDFQQCPAGYQLFQPASKLLAFSAMYSQFANELLEARGVPGLSFDVGKDFAVGNHLGTCERCYPSGNCTLSRNAMGDRYFA